MESIGDMLRSKLSDRELETLGRKLEADSEQTGRAIDVALPELLQQLQRNASSRQGLESLERAIDRDHDGSILDRLPDQLENPNEQDGEGILRHVFGNDKDAVAQRLGASSGISAGNMSKLLVTLAPLLLGMLGKMKGGQGGGLGDILGGGGKKAGCLGMLMPLLGKFLGGRR